MVKISIRSFISCFLVAGAITLAIAAEGDSYIWPSYSPSLNYNFKDRMGSFPMPTKDLDDCNGVVGTQSSDWWTFKWGKNKKSVVTEAAITPLLERLNTDFAYFRDSMGWAPDLRVQDGYRSAVYLYGSGLCTDNADSTELGGWQSGIAQYPMILASYYPIYSFDPTCTYGDKVSQQGAMVHEGIHALLASLPGAKQAAWFQEGGNTWLQQEAAARRSEDYSEMGFLNAAALIAPFMPIETYSGWLQDGSFGGPSAEGVNMYNGTQQICTWKNLLGGTQYGNIFPTFLGEWLGVGTVPWIWNYATGRVLEGLSDTLGDAQTRRLITEYRARLALLDMKKWSNATKQLLNDNFGSPIKAEWSPYNIDCESWTATPYAKTTDSSGTLIPEARTTPGWSGANIIPLKVSGSSVSVTLLPIGENMSLQICYRATDGTPIYSTPVTSGTALLRLDKTPMNDVVFAVICNTNYIYEGEATRKAHYDYRLTLGTGVTSTADINTKWYNVDLSYEEPTSVRPPVIKANTVPHMTLNNDHGSILINYTLSKNDQVKLSLYTAYGALITHIVNEKKQAGAYSERIDLSKMGISQGTYLVKLKTGTFSESKSITSAK